MCSSSINYQQPQQHKPILDQTSIDRVVARSQIVLIGEDGALTTNTKRPRANRALLNSTAALFTSPMFHESNFYMKTRDYYYVLIVIGLLTSGIYGCDVDHPSNKKETICTPTASAPMINPSASKPSSESFPPSSETNVCTVHLTEKEKDHIKNLIHNSNSPTCLQPGLYAPPAELQRKLRDLLDRQRQLLETETQMIRKTGACRQRQSTLAHKSQQLLSQHQAELSQQNSAIQNLQKDHETALQVERLKCKRVIEGCHRQLREERKIQRDIYQALLTSKADELKYQQALEQECINKRYLEEFYDSKLQSQASQQRKLTQLLADSKTVQNQLEDYIECQMRKSKRLNHGLNASKVEKAELLRRITEERTNQERLRYRLLQYQLQEKSLRQQLSYLQSQLGSSFPSASPTAGVTTCCEQPHHHDSRQMMPMNTADMMTIGSTHDEALPTTTAMNDKQRLFQSDFEALNHCTLGGDPSLVMTCGVNGDIFMSKHMDTFGTFKLSYSFLSSSGTFKVWVNDHDDRSIAIPGPLLERMLQNFTRVKYIFTNTVDLFLLDEYCGVLYSHKDILLLQNPILLYNAPDKISIEDTMIPASPSPHHLPILDHIGAVSDDVELKELAIHWLSLPQSVLFFEDPTAWRLLSTDENSTGGTALTKCQSVFIKKTLNGRLTLFGGPYLVLPHSSNELTEAVLHTTRATLNASYSTDRQSKISLCVPPLALKMLLLLTDVPGWPIVTQY